jgi:hypothetical protein
VLACQTVPDADRLQHPCRRTGDRKRPAIIAGIQRPGEFGLFDHGDLQAMLAQRVGEREPGEAATDNQNINIYGGLHRHILQNVFRACPTGFSPMYMSRVGPEDRCGTGDTAAHRLIHNSPRRLDVNYG